MVATRAGVDTDRNRPGAELRIPLGYVYTTDLEGRTHFQTVKPTTTRNGKQSFRLGGWLFGKSITVDWKDDLRSGHTQLTGIDTQIGIGHIRLSSRFFGLEYGNTKAIPAVVDVTDSFLREAGITRRP